MSVSMRDAGPGMGLAGPELARAMQAGLEMRRFAALEAKAQVAGLARSEIQPLPAMSPVELPSPRQGLESRANVLGHPATARPGALGYLLRQTRRVVRRLLRPWFEVQTHFNHAAIDTLEISNRALKSQLDQMIARLNAQAQMLADLRGSLDECTRVLQSRQSALDVRLDEQHECLHHFRRNLEARIDDARNAPAADESPALLEHLFVHARLPAPPARILDLSWSPHSVIEMSSLGYQVVRIDPRRSNGSPLEFEDECFDAVVHLSSASEVTTHSLEDLTSELARVVSPGGRLLFTGRWRFDGELSHSPGLPTGFQITERAFAIHEHGTWSYTTDERRAKIIHSVNPTQVVALVRAEKC
jgi:hypothetical protein